MYFSSKLSQIYLNSSVTIPLESYFYIREWKSGIIRQNFTKLT